MPEKEAGGNEASREVKAERLNGLRLESQENILPDLEESCLPAAFTARLTCNRQILKIIINMKIFSLAKVAS